MLPSRFLFVDGLRGLAALAVVLFHIGRDFLGIPFLFFGMHGVTIFFVLSGFVISHSLAKKKITGIDFFAFVVKRSVRLDPAYWVAIFSAIFFVWVPSLLLGFKVELPSVSSVLIHMLYMQGLLGVKPINVVFWTLAYEIQFYIVFCGLLYFIEKSNLSKFTHYIFAGLLVAFLLWPLKLITSNIPGLFVDLFFLFLLGVFARWAIDSRIALFSFFLAFFVLLFLYFINGEDLLFVGVVTGLFLFIALNKKKMNDWLSWHWIQYFGAISYSLYLIHDIVGLYVRDTGIHLTNKYFYLTSYFVNSFWCAVAVAASIFCAELLYRYVEVPSHNFSRKISVSSLAKKLNRVINIPSFFLRKMRFKSGNK